jgi:hypothetical protein
MESDSESEADDEIASFLKRSTAANGELSASSGVFTSKHSVVAGIEPCSGLLWSSEDTVLPEETQLIPSNEHSKSKRSSNEMGISVAVGRPLTFRGHSVSYAHEPRTLAGVKAMNDWYCSILDHYSEAGISNDQLISMFHSVPDELGCVIKKCLQALHSIQATRNKMSRSAQISFSDTSSTEVCKNVDIIGDELHGEKDACGHFNISWDPSMQVWAPRKPGKPTPLRYFEISAL